MTELIFGTQTVSRQAADYVHGEFGGQAVTELTDSRLHMLLKGFTSEAVLGPNWNQSRGGHYELKISTHGEVSQALIIGSNFVELRTRIPSGNESGDETIVVETLGCYANGSSWASRLEVA